MTQDKDARIAELEAEVERLLKAIDDWQTFASDAAGAASRAEALSRTGAQRQDGEAVAWRGIGEDNVSDVTDSRDTADQWKRDGIPVTPLYASPRPANPAQVTGVMVEAASAKYREIGARCNWQHSWPSEEAFHEIITAAIGAGGQAVAVKALEWWTASTGDIISDSIVGRYRLGKITANENYRLETPSGLMEKPSPDYYWPEREAKAAAQADYERRILAALEPAAPERVPALTQVGWAYQDKKWDADRWHVCGWEKPREHECRRVEPIYIVEPPAPEGRQEAVEALGRVRDYADKPHADRYVIRNMAEAALKAAMEAGR